MKWSKYMELAADPRLGSLLSWHVGRGYTGHNSTVQPRIENAFKYIAVRPWESLDFNAAGRPEGFDRIEYWVHYHILNDENHGRYVREAGFNGQDPFTSVAGQLEWIKQWHGEYWAKQDGNHPAVIDAIVQHRWLGKYESLDIYLPPTDYTL